MNALLVHEHKLDALLARSAATLAQRVTSLRIKLPNSYGVEAANSTPCGVVRALVSGSSSSVRDALDLLRELGEADDLRDRSHWYLPSIRHHLQNRGFRDWVSLIELLRDA